MPSESSFNPEAEAISFMSLTLAPAQVNEPKAANHDSSPVLHRRRTELHGQQGKYRYYK